MKKVVDDVVAEVAMCGVGRRRSLQNNVDLERMECGDTQISCMAARVWQDHSTHADLRKVSSQKRPSTEKRLTGPSGAHPTERPSFRRKTPGVQSRLTGLRKHTDLRRSRIQGAQLGWQGHKHTQGIVIPRYLRHADLKEVVLVSKRPT
jgi:hypothetical protein